MARRGCGLFMYVDPPRCAEAFGERVGEEVVGGGGERESCFGEEEGVFWF